MSVGVGPLTDAWTFRAEPPEPGSAVVVDLDGVLSDAAGRQHFLDGSRHPKDWDAFFAACGDDPLVEEVHRLLDLLASDLVVVLLTARPVSVRPQTLAWLRRYRVRWDVLLMRPDGDGRLAVRFKQDAVHALREAGYDLALAFEDDRRNVAMLRSAGVPCLYVHSGYYD